MRILNLWVFIFSVPKSARQLKDRLLVLIQDDGAQILEIIMILDCELFVAISFC